MSQTNSTINLTINGDAVQAEAGQTILEAARAAGIYIPTLCHHAELDSYGSCRLCVVEIGSGERKKVVASCLYQVAEGLVVETESDKIKGFRRTILNLLMHRWDKIPEELLERYGAKSQERFVDNMTYCILCGLCVRYCHEIKQANVLGFIGRGTIRQVVIFPNQSAKYCAELCPEEMECLDFCPTGVISSQYYGNRPADGQVLPHAHPVCINEDVNILEILERVGNV